MKTVFWTGKLSPPLKLIVNTSALLAWFTGAARNTSAMKQRLRNGYNGVYSDYVSHYDELGLNHFNKISTQLLEKADIRGKEVLDIGCGTGILSLLALEKGAAKMVCSDISKNMIDQCRAKIASKGYSDKVIEFHENDAESLPFADNSVDVIISSLMLGFLPDQSKAVAEMTRVLRPGGTIAISTHGPNYFIEAIEGLLKAMTMQYFLGYRFEFWPRKEDDIKNIFVKFGLENIVTRELTSVNNFENGGKAFDFFASVSSLWWYDKLPTELREKEKTKTREYFERKRITQITSDVIFAYATKK